jgi:hypothetical protein
VDFKAHTVVAFTYLLHIPTSQDARSTRVEYRTVIHVYVEYLFHYMQLLSFERT